MRFRPILGHLCLACLVAFSAAFMLLAAYATRPHATFGLAPAAISGEFQQFYPSQLAPQLNGFVRWSMPQAALNLPRSGENAILTLDLASGQQVPVALTLASGGEGSTVMVAAEPRRYQVLARTNQLSTRFQVELSSEQAPPTADDERVRGVVLRGAALRGDGRAPLGILLLGVGAALLALIAFRLAGLRGRFAAGATMMSTAVFALALALGAWQIWWLAEQVALFVSLCLAVLVLCVLLRRFEVVAPHPAWHVLALCALVIPLRLALVPMPDPIGDLSSFFLSWAVWARSHGIDQLYASGSDYPPLWPLVLGRIGALAELLNLRFTEPLPPPAGLLLKLPAILADVALAVTVYVYALRWRPSRQAFGIAAVAALLPPLWIDSAWWGQIDALPILAVVLALLLFGRQHGLWSWALFALALLLKFQVVIFAPLFGLLALRRYGLRWLAAGLAAGTAVFAAVGVPLLAAGQGNGLREAYLSSVDRYPYISMHAYNLWALVTRGRGIYDYSRLSQGMDDRTIWFAGLSYHQAGLALFGALVVAVCVLLWRRYDREGASISALLLAIGFYMLPTQMHERYLLPIFPLLLLWWARDTAARWPLATLSVTTTLTLLRAFPLWPAAHTLLTPLAVPMALAALNLAVMVALGWRALHIWRAGPVVQISRRSIARRPRSLHPRSRQLLRRG